MKKTADHKFLILVLLVSVLSFIGLYYYHKGHMASKTIDNGQILREKARQ